MLRIFGKTVRAETGPSLCLECFGTGEKTIGNRRVIRTPGKVVMVSDVRPCPVCLGIGWIESHDKRKIN